ncbi:MAG: 50S ribosomal protein L9 [candidate division WOR-3 bacterium]|nr:50S ribosomal protein L9 [candidate division WOR-3 bacterium]MCX7948186.1 50S ribosomal protein L9 [candidate division WOR-3 bacterium]MDW8151117.1 50S ribosomal protein L9 [candidate division WOR-3 bacterium]
MKKVKVITKDGKVIEVKYGYAFNYLIRKGLAELYTESKMKEIEHLKKVKLEKLEREKKKALKLKEELDKEKITFLVKVGENDRMYGSITSKDIFEKLIEKGYEIDRKMILLDEPIKALGNYKVQVKLHPEVIAEIKIKVEKE